MTRTFDVAVLGGGPAGYAAALAAARAGASVVLAEPERLGGTCVHWSCIPTNVLLSSAHVSLEARELAFLGVLEAGDHVDLRRLGERRTALVRTLAGGITSALRAAKVEVLAGRATLATPLRHDGWRRRCPDRGRSPVGGRRGGRSVGGADAARRRGGPDPHRGPGAGARCPTALRARGRWGTGRHCVRG